MLLDVRCQYTEKGKSSLRVMRKGGPTLYLAFTTPGDRDAFKRTWLVPLLR